MSDTHSPPVLSPSEARHVDQACDRFEAAWKAGERPRLEDYLGPAEDPLKRVEVSEKKPEDASEATPAHASDKHRFADRRR